MLVYAFVCMSCLWICVCGGMSCLWICLFIDMCMSYLLISVLFMDLCMCLVNRYVCVLFMELCVCVCYDCAVTVIVHQRARVRSCPSWPLAQAL